MFRIAALNDSLSSDGSDSQAFVGEVTKEAKEAEAYTLYNKALELLRHGESSAAENVFRDLIDHDFLVEAWELLQTRGSEAIHPGLQLLYSIQKNLAAMATQRKDFKAALESYLEAVKIDNTEVTVWYKVGITALSMEDFQLAMLAFEQGLECNPKHWPCLHQIIPLLYALNNYIECLYFVSRALEMEVQYMKGHAFREKIYSEQPSFKSDAEEFFLNCDYEIHTVCIDKEEAAEYIDEALRMRKRNQVLCKPPPPARLTFPPRIKEYTWKHIGEVLCQLYDKATSANPPISISLKVDVPDYSQLPTVEDTGPPQPNSTQADLSGNAMEVDVDTPSSDKKENEILKTDVASDGKADEMLKQTGIENKSGENKNSENKNSEDQTSEATCSNNDDKSEMQGSVQGIEEMEVDKSGSNEVSEINTSAMDEGKLAMVLDGGKSSLNGPDDKKPTVLVVESVEDVAKKQDLVAANADKLFRPIREEIKPDVECRIDEKPEVKDTKTGEESMTEVGWRNCGDLVTKLESIEDIEKTSQDSVDDKDKGANSDISNKGENSDAEEDMEVGVTEPDKNTDVSEKPMTGSPMTGDIPSSASTSDHVSAEQSSDSQFVNARLSKSGSFGFTVSPDNKPLDVMDFEGSVKEPVADAITCQSPVDHANVDESAADVATAKSNVDSEAQSGNVLVFSKDGSGDQQIEQQRSTNDNASSVSTPGRELGNVSADQESSAECRQVVSDSTTTTNIVISSSPKPSPAPLPHSGTPNSPIVLDMSSSSQSQTAVDLSSPTKETRKDIAPLSDIPATTMSAEVTITPSSTSTSISSSTSPSVPDATLTTSLTTSSELSTSASTALSQSISQPRPTTVPCSDSSVAMSAMEGAIVSSAETLPKVVTSVVASSEVSSLTTDASTVPSHDESAPSVSVTSAGSTTPGIIDLSKPKLETDSSTAGAMVTSSVLSASSSGLSQATTIQTAVVSSSAPVSVNNAKPQPSLRAVLTKPTTLLPFTSPMSRNSPRNSPKTVTANNTSDHGYSRAYTEMPSPSSPRGAHGYSPGGTVILQESQLAGTFMEYSVDGNDRSGKKGQKRKRISCTTEEIMMYGKRRSARVRNTGRKKEEETVNFHDLLQAFLPSSIKNMGEDDIINIDDDKDQAEAAAEDLTTSVRKGQVTMATEDWNEEELVKAYLHKCINNHGLVSMMNQYLHILAKHHQVKWPLGLCEMYLAVFNRVRKHIYMPRVFERSDPPEVFQEMAQICLLWLELQLDEWCIARDKTQAGTMATSPSSADVEQTLSEDDIPEFYNEDLWFVCVLCGLDDVLGELWTDHCVRVYWAKAKYALIRNKTEEAVFCYGKTIEYIEFIKEEIGVDKKIFLPNCKHDNHIELEIVKGEKEVLEKSQSVGEAQRLFDGGEYEKVVQIMTKTLHAQTHKALTEASERQGQLLLLLESLEKLGDLQKVLVWGEELFTECYNRYLTCYKIDERAEWIKTIITVFKYLQRSLENGASIVKSLSSTKITRFSQNLIKMVDTNMSLPESITEMKFDTVLPWILLYYIIKQEEDKLGERRLKGSGAELQDNLSSSHMLLNIAHDYLGSRSWCTKSDGSMLLFFMKVLKVKLEDENSKFLEEYQQAFEQCVFCLFGHPNKKAKAKHLQDHNAAAITMDWEHAILVFDYFKTELPEFDGYKSETISAELEYLFLNKIIPLIPESSKRMGYSLDMIQDFVEGRIDSLPPLHEEQKVTLPVVDEVFYLLGDYYLKNKEFLKAIKYYLKDLCFKADRLDAWAGMALARMSRIDAKLASTDLTMDIPLYKSVATLRCFKRAVEIDDSNIKLWIEYGTLAYQLHSHACRQIKWAKKPYRLKNMEEKFIDLTETSKGELLQTARHCFSMASECDPDMTEDMWLFNYMLGKCGEKAGKPLQEFMPYYYKAMECIHEEYAKYPKRIVFSYTTPHLSVEALEMYYRMHINVMKMLFKYPATSDKHDYKLYLRYILEAATQPFVKRVEKGQEVRTDRESASSADESSCSAYSTPVKPHGPKQPSPDTDHTYFRQKSLQGVNSPCTANKNQSPSEAGTPLIGSKSVTTLELHSEEQTTTPDVTLTATECPALPTLESSQTGEATLGNQQTTGEPTGKDQKTDQSEHSAREATLKDQKINQSQASDLKALEIKKELIEDSEQDVVLVTDKTDDDVMKVEPGSSSSVAPSSIFKNETENMKEATSESDKKVTTSASKSPFSISSILSKDSGRNETKPKDLDRVEKRSVSVKRKLEDIDSPKDKDTGGGSPTDLDKDIDTLIKEIEDEAAGVVKVTKDGPERKENVAERKEKVTERKEKVTERKETVPELKEGSTRDACKGDTANDAGKEVINVLKNIMDSIIEDEINRDDSNEAGDRNMGNQKVEAMQVEGQDERKYDKRSDQNLKNKDSSNDTQGNGDNNLTNKASSGENVTETAACPPIVINVDSSEEDEVKGTEEEQKTTHSAMEVVEHDEKTRNFCDSDHKSDDDSAKKHDDERDSVKHGGDANNRIGAVDDKAGVGDESGVVAMETDDDGGKDNAQDNIKKERSKIANEGKGNGSEKDTEATKEDKTGNQDNKRELRLVDQINNLLKLPVDELHRELLERCRKALELCLQRFPTHYKSHHSLARLYMLSPYHKDLKKAHNIMLGVPKWQQLEYMPCQGLFGERKATKFFQSIWKIPIDEIDRSGSFPAHLNRCVELALEILREEHDSLTLHQVHLQLNRQTDPFRKYLRDADKKCYAVLSHEYTLDAVESQISEMKGVTDTEKRMEFLQTVYKIWEHGVQKLVKHVERTNRLLAEAYRVVVRKLETLPHKMLLVEAKRFCKQMSQKPKSDKPQDTLQSPSQAAGQSASAPSLPFQQMSSDIPTSTIRPPALISLANIMKSQVSNLSLLKSGGGGVSINTDQSKHSGGGLMSPGGSGLPNSVKGLHSGGSGLPANGSGVRVGGSGLEEDVIVLSDSSEGFDEPKPTTSKSDGAVSKVASSTPRSAASSPLDLTIAGAANKPASPAQQASNAPTVKIKMGLLQAAKRLKPVGGTESPKDSSSGSSGNKMNVDITEPSVEGGAAAAGTSAILEDENEAPLFSAVLTSATDTAEENNGEEPSDSSSSESSSGDESSSSSSDDDGSSSEEEEDGSQAEEVADDNKGGKVADVNDDDDDKNADETDGGGNSKKGETNGGKVVKQTPKLKMKVVVATTEDEEESSDNDEEIDLVSSEAEADDDKDKDYNASDDEPDDDDVIMISDEEFVYTPKGKLVRAVIPSPPPPEQGTEVLVKELPDFDPLISSMISGDFECPVPVGPPIANKSFLEKNEGEEN